MTSEAVPLPPGRPRRAPAGGRSSRRETRCGAAPPRGASTASRGPTPWPTSSACAARCSSSTPWRAAAPSAVEAAARRAVRPRSARSPATRPCSRCARGSKAIYLSGWQVAADANLAGQMYPDQSLYPANSVPAVVAHQPGAAARRPDRARRGQERARLVRAHRGRRRGRLRRPAQRLRADEGHDRGGRRRRALRGPARLGEEVRPHGRQGARADVSQFIRTLSPRASPPT
jgi:hypothetical protein